MYISVPIQIISNCDFIAHCTLKTMYGRAYLAVYLFFIFSFSPPIWKVPWAMNIEMCAVCMPQTVCIRVVCQQLEIKMRLTLRGAYAVHKSA